VRILSIDLIDIILPLVSPFTTSFSTQTSRAPLLVKVTAEHNGREVTGWGECVVLDEPVYSPEYLDGAREVLQRFLIPALYAWQDAGRALTAELVGHVLEHIVGHRMAKAALEMAILDAQLRATDISFASYFGATVDAVPSGVSVGIQKSIPDLLSAVGGYVDQGYVRIKLKIQQGWDIEPVRAVRERFGDIPLQVDANTAYRLVDAPHLRKLDPFNLLLIEQPLAEDDLRQHALLAREISTPMCLDESIVSAASAADAIAMGAAAIINIKPGRVGGYLEAKRIHDIAVANGVAVWCGGMLETGLGRAANAALAGLPGFTLPGDISASDRFYKQDITEPFRIEDGQIRIPSGAGIGVEPIPAVLAEATTATVTVAPRRAQLATASARRR
jgi:O-succinylbenzoate synthase